VHQVGFIYKIAFIVFKARNVWDPWRIPAGGKKLK